MIQKGETRALQAGGIPGLAPTQVVVVANAVQQYPDVTSLELAYCSGLDRYVIARRLPEAEQAGLVKRGGMRKCQLSERRSVTWNPIH